MDGKKYRVEYNRFGVVSIQEDGEFNTATANSVIADTLANIRLMLTALGIDCSALDSYSV